MIATKPLLACFLAAALTACAATPSHQLVPQPIADAAPVPKHATRVYVARSAQVRGTLRPVQVIEDEVEIGVLGHNGYLCWERPAGNRVLRLIFHGRKIDSGDVETVVASDGAAGETLFFQVDLGATGTEPSAPHDRDKPKVTQLTPEQGRALIADRSPARVE